MPTLRRDSSTQASRYAAPSSIPQIAQSSSAPEREARRMTTVMKASGSAEFLGMVPALAGYTPTRSLVVAPFTRGRCHGVLRVDIPDDPSPEFADGMADLARRIAGTDAVAIVIYTDEQPQATHDGLLLPQSVLADLVLGACSASSIAVVDALCVCDAGWSSYLADHPRLRPLTEISTTAVPPDARPADGDQSVGATLPRLSKGEKEQMKRAIHQLESAMDASRTGTGRIHPDAIAASALLDDVPSLLEDALTASKLVAPFEGASLLWLLNRPLFRDVALAQWARDKRTGERTLDEQLEHHVSGALPSEDIAVMLMGVGTRPDPARLRAALTRMKHLAAVAPRPHRVGPLAVAAWTSWAMGRATHASSYLDALERIDRQYSFGRLLRTLFDTKPLPDWVFDAGVDA